MYGYDDLLSERVRWSVICWICEYRHTDRVKVTSTLLSGYLIDRRISSQVGTKKKGGIINLLLIATAVFEDGNCKLRSIDLRLKICFVTVYIGLCSGKLCDARSSAFICFFSYGIDDWSFDSGPLWLMRSDLFENVAILLCQPLHHLQGALST
jgi:hypothetical protein